MSILNLILVGFLIRVQAQQTLQELDDSIRTQAFQRLAPLPKTGVIYNVTLDSNGNNVRVQAVRLRSGSLRRHGLVCNEFNIPVQSLVETTSKYVVLVYRQFLSSYPAPLPENYTRVAPVLGIKVYEGNDLTNTAAQEVNVFSGPTTISVQVPVRSRTLARAFCALYGEKQSNWKIFNDDEEGQDIQDGVSFRERRELTDGSYWRQPCTGSWSNQDKASA